MKFDLGRRVLGLAAIFLGVVTFVWHDFNIWQQIQPLGNLSHPAIVVYLAAIVQTFGGLALQSRRTAPGGAIALGVVDVYKRQRHAVVFHHGRSRQLRQTEIQNLQPAVVADENVFRLDVYKRQENRS